MDGNILSLMEMQKTCFPNNISLMSSILASLESDVSPCKNVGDK